jgi:hypothetical protein
MSSVSVLSIHDSNGPLLAFDLKDILQALKPIMDRWTWYVYSLETVGDVSGPACWDGTWLTTGELMNLASEVTQTIEGTFIAFPHEPGGRNTAATDLNERAFPTSRAELLITAIDGGFFEVYTKDRKVTELLRRRFKDVREEDPNMYF